MSNTFDIVSFLDSNPITKLSEPYRNSLVNKIKHAFSEEEQKLYVASFYLYLNYNTKTDFVVSLDDVWEWLGFSRIDPAKRMLVTNFTRDIDYKILLHPKVEHSEKHDSAYTTLLLPKVEQNNFNKLTTVSGKEVRGGHNKETVLMNINTFKKLCLKAETKKADTIHDYYIKLEELVHEVMDEQTSELRIKLEQAGQQLQSTKVALEAEKAKCAKILKKKCHEQAPGEVVYIFKCNAQSNDNLHKVGRTSNIAHRESGHINSNILGEVVHTRRCINSDLLEKVCHHMLDKYRVLNTREWFDIPFDVTKKVVDSAQIFLDSFIDTICDVDLLTPLQSLADTVNSDILPENEHKQKNMYDILEEKKQQEKEEAIQKIDLATINVEDPLNFDKFVQDCCEVGDDDSFVALKADLHGAHKLWSRNAEAGTKKSLFEYLEGRFKADKKFFAEYNAVLAVYHGVKLKPYEFKPQDPLNPTEIERYIMANCKVGFTYRVPFRAVFDDFEAWKAINQPHYKIDNKTKDTIRDYLSVHFFPKGVYLSEQLRDIDGGKTNGFGVWGITLKNDNSKTGVKLANKLKKTVVQVDIVTKQITATYESVMATARAYNVTPSFISTDIKFKRIRNNSVFMFLKDYNNS